MIDVFLKGGVVMWPILLLAVLSIIIVIERLIYLRKINVDEDRLFQRVKGALEKGHYDEAKAICDNTESPLGALIVSGIDHRHESEYAQKEVLKDAASQEVPRLEKYIGALGTISHIAPLLGLLGTVTGNIAAFGVLGTMGSVADPAVLASGIAEALITTAAGIIVAIPSVIFYNYLVGRVNRIITRMETQVNELILVLRKPDQTQGVSNRAL
jgi:biopolymer transport protein ExbB